MTAVEHVTPCPACGLPAAWLGRVTTSGGTEYRIVCPACETESEAAA